MLEHLDFVLLLFHWFALAVVFAVIMNGQKMNLQGEFQLKSNGELERAIFGRGLPPDSMTPENSLFAWAGTGTTGRLRRGSERQRAVGGNGDLPAQRPGKPLWA